MHFHPGVDPDKAMFGYMQALQGFTIEAIAAGILKFLRGECEGVNPKYCPHPPELAQIVRTAVVPNRIPQERRIVHHTQLLPGEKARLRLKVPLWQAAENNPDRLNELARANAAGFGAMVVLASKWRVPVPQELLDMPEDQAEREWHRARNNALAAIEADPPPYMRNKRRKSAA
jgi:hypothetical protein